MSTIVGHEKAVLEALEPEACYERIDAACRISTAISMRRIADFLAGSVRNEDAVQYAMRELNIRR